MKTIRISDITLRECAGNKKNTLSFREKLEFCRAVGRLHVDTIELPPIGDSRTDRLLSKTAATATTAPVVIAVGYTPESVAAAYECVKEAKTPILHVMLPVSPIRMEYTCHKKAPAMLVLCEELVTAARALCPKVEFTACDATNAEPGFLEKMIRTAVKAGAERVTIADATGHITPAECEKKIANLYKALPELHSVVLSVEISDGMGMALAVSAAALSAGADGVKVTVPQLGFPTLENAAHYLRVKGGSLGYTTPLRLTELSHTVKRLERVFDKTGVHEDVEEAADGGDDDEIRLTPGDNLSDVERAVQSLGYELSEEDMKRVYAAFSPLAEKKSHVGRRELEAIIATSAAEVPETYRLVSYVTNSGNIITATASVELDRNGEKLSGIAGGDGPIDAAFRAIEQIVGHHYELDEFRIQSVTEGREAIGSALVRLRADGRLYAGSGISTDIVGASIHAYLSALNKIVYEET